MTKWQKTKVFFKTLVRPHFFVGVDKTNKGYIITMTLTVMGKSKGIQISAMEAAKTEVNLIEILKQAK